MNQQNQSNNADEGGQPDVVVRIQNIEDARIEIIDVRWYNEEHTEVECDYKVWAQIKDGLEQPSCEALIRVGNMSETVPMREMEQNQYETDPRTCNCEVGDVICADVKATWFEPKSGQWTDVCSEVPAPNTGS